MVHGITAAKQDLRSLKDFVNLHYSV